MKRNLLMMIFVVGLLAACSDGESGNAGSLANALAGKTFDLDLDTTSSSCSADSDTSANSAPINYHPADTAYPSDTASGTESTFLVKHTHETDEDAGEPASPEPVAPTIAEPASYTITFTSSTYTIKSGSTVVETGTWKAIDGNTAEVKSDGVTTRVNVDVDGETLYVSTTAADCSSTIDVQQPMEETSMADSIAPSNDTADDSTNFPDYYYYVDDGMDDPAITADMSNSY